MHDRTAIRDQIKTLLDSQTPAGTRVYPSRRTRIRVENLPCIVIYTSDETADEFEAAPRSLRRSLTVSIEIAVNAAGDEAVDETLDDFAETIEALIASDDTLNSTVADIILSRSTSTIVEDGEQPIGALRMDYRATYYTHIPAASYNDDLDDLATVDTRYNLSGLQETADETQDTITGLDV